MNISKILLLGFLVFCSLQMAAAAAGLGEDGYKGDPVSSFKKKITIKGRLAFEENWGCDSSVPGQFVSGQECHQYKHRFYGAGPNLGKPVTEDLMPEEIYDSVTGELYPLLRPFSAQVKISLFKGTKPDLQLCDVSKVVQTDSEGNFEVDLQACGAGQKVIVSLEAKLVYQLKGFDKTGAIVAGWPQNEGGEEVKKTNSLDLLVTKIMAWDINAQPQFFLGQVPTYEDATGKKSQTPTFNFFTAFDEAPSVDLGTLVFLGSQTAQDFYFNYVRQVVSGFQNVVELHRRLRAEFMKSLVPDQYVKAMFLWDKNLNVSKSLDVIFSDTGFYFVNVDATWAFGGLGGISFFGPYAEKLGDDPMDLFWLIGGTQTIAHEFGHSVHAAFASSSFTYDYSFANNYRRPNPLPKDYAQPAEFKTLDDFKAAIKDDPEKYPHPIYDIGHDYGQYQELGTAFVEGFASSLGQYILNRCAHWDDSSRPSGGPVGGSLVQYDDSFLGAVFNSTSSCDKKDGCSNHFFRYQMLKRGVVEDSKEWIRRRDQLQTLIKRIYAMGETAVRVTANNEARWSQLGCDLLDSVPGNKATFLNIKSQYIADSTYIAAEIMDGTVKDVDSFIAGYKKTWADTGYEENLSLDLIPFLRGMANFVKSKPGAEFDPPGTPAAVEMPNTGHKYNVLRLSTNSSPLSPLSLGKYFVGKGLLSQPQWASLLRSNFIDTGDLSAPSFVSSPDVPLGLTQSVIDTAGDEIPGDSTTHFVYTYLEGISQPKPKLKAQVVAPSYKYAPCVVRFSFTELLTNTVFEHDTKKNKNGEATWVQSMDTGVWVWGAKQVCENGKESVVAELPRVKIGLSGKLQHFTSKHVPLCLFGIPPPVVPTPKVPEQLQFTQDVVEYKFQAESYNCMGNSVGFEFEFTEPFKSDLPFTQFKKTVDVPPAAPPAKEESLWVKTTVNKVFMRPLPYEVSSLKPIQAFVRVRAYVVTLLGIGGSPGSNYEGKTYSDWSDPVGVSVPMYQKFDFTAKSRTTVEGWQNYGFNSGPNLPNLKDLQWIEKSLIPSPLPTTFPTGGGDPSPMDRRKPFK
ncbi:hypothetical protein WDW86_16455 [Bdellovibrionota bacterium FG-2]